MHGKINAGVSRQDHELAAVVEAALAASSTDGAKSRTLPPAAYTSRSFFELECEAVFRRDWVCVGHVSQVANVGDYFTVDFLGELLVVVRGADRIRVMSRVCLHRWAPIAEGEGNTKLFSCPFHKWGYALDGQLLGAPFMDRASEFAPKDCRLPEIRSELVESLGLIYITFSETVGSISERLADLSERLSPLPLKDMVVVKTRTAENDYNWKILIETFMECYHHIGAHRTTLEPNFPARLSYVEPMREGWSVCHSPLREEIAHEAYMDDEKRPFSLFLVFPALLMGASYDLERSDRINLITVLPLAPNKVVSKRHTLVRREAVGTPETVAMLERQAERGAAINKEDNDVNNMQQIGAASSFASVGRLSHLEGSAWHLAEYVRSRLAAE